MLIGGAPTDNNALLFRKGQMNVIQPLVDKGAIKIISDQWAKDWQAVEALKIMENALTRSNNQVDAVVASNDGVAGGAIQALAEQKLAGKVLVSGQDAELVACQRIVAGTQSMTVYKPIKLLAHKAAEVAMQAGPQAAPRRGDQAPQQRQDRRAQHPSPARRGGQGQHGGHGDRRRLPQARAGLPGRPEGTVAEAVS